jgi:hypothetical protein
MTYKIEFPDYDDTITIPEGWLDDSWHNDICPKITKGTWVIWCDYKDPDRREIEGQQFVASTNIDGSYEPLHQFDNLGDAVAFCQEVQA